MAGVIIFISKDRKLIISKMSDVYYSFVGKIIMKNEIYRAAAAAAVVGRVCVKLQACIGTHSYGQNTIYWRMMSTVNVVFHF